MKIAILGYGKMGKAIEEIAVERKHTVVYKTSNQIEPQKVAKADVAIDFSVPDAAFTNITTCFSKKVPVVSGTTGWLEKYDEAVKICKEKNSSFIYASNFSLGVNLFFELNKKLAKMMKDFEEYTATIEEIHHTQKLDKPSGTAITLAKDLLENSSKTSWKFIEEENVEIDKATLPVYAKRLPEVHGTHSIKYASEIDDIEIKHTAHSRKGFALGAVIAAEWLQDKKGIFSMKDVLEI